MRKRAIMAVLAAGVLLMGNTAQVLAAEEAVSEEAVSEEEIAEETDTEESSSEEASTEETSAETVSAQETTVEGSAAEETAAEETVAEDTIDIENYDAESGDEIMLAAFFTSQADTTDTLYWSTDGENFYEICEAYTDATPNDESSTRIAGDPAGRNDSTLHDPGIAYRNGYFWMISGFTLGTGSSRMFIPMLGYSKDLIHWNYPASGSSTNVKLTTTPAGSEKNGGDWDMVAPDLFVDTDGTMWIVASFGYYANYHGDESKNDIMQPYLVKVQSVTVGDDPAVNKITEPHITYGSAVPINLPCMTDSSYGRTAVANNHIDGSFYKEGGYYYFVVKENGVSNEIWRIKDLNKVSDVNAWEQVVDDAVTGYEGPSLTKFNGQYFLYTDRLWNYVPEDTSTAFGSTGVWVTKASTRVTATGAAGTLNDYAGFIDKGIKEVKCYDLNGNRRATRHGSVITLTGEAAKKVRAVVKSISTKNTKDTTNHYKASSWVSQGWFKKESYRSDKLGSKVVRYWYENDARQGISTDPQGVMGGVGEAATNRGREIYDPDSNAWYWLDSIYDGAEACNKEVWMPYIYQQEASWSEAEIESNAAASGYMADQVKKAIHTKTGKWVRYDWEGKMIKGWYGVTDDFQKNLYPAQAGNVYYYDNKTGLMAKGPTVVDGVQKNFDEITGVEQNVSANETEE